MRMSISNVEQQEHGTMLNKTGAAREENREPARIKMSPGRDCGVAIK